ncbi:MAG: hypothetical protein M5U34_21455 [Chloroflexi bacterium]|nr:hypothetical protein [Chloroflexota bacterium]
MDLNPRQIHLDDSQIVEDEISSPPIYLVSGNIGALAEQVVRTVLPPISGRSHTGVEEDPCA